MKQCLFRRVSWIAVVLLLQSMTVAAAEVNFYSETVVVKSQTVPERERAAAEGLAKVLVRVSGVPDVSGAAGPILTDASRYIDQFQYRHTLDAKSNPVDQLQMTFTPAVIDQLLRQAHLPLWPLNRPKVLVWLVVEDPKLGRQWVGDNSTDIVNGLREGAAARGLQLRWPNLDLDDQMAMNTSDAWTFQREKILTASDRYQVDTVLVGRYLKTPQGQWWTSWQYFHHGENQFYDLRLDNGVDAGRQAIHPLANYLAKRYSVMAGSEGQTKSKWVVQVNSVESFEDYRGVTDALNQIAVITSSRLTSVNASTLVFEIELSGGEQQLQNALSLDRNLRFDHLQTGSPELGSVTNPLRLEWTSR